MMLNKKYKKKAMKVFARNVFKVKKNFSKLLVKFYQVQINISNRASMVRGKHNYIHKKPGAFSDKEIGTSKKFKEKVEELEHLLEDIDRTMEVLNAISDDFFQESYSDCDNLSKASNNSAMSSRRDLTNFFENVSFFGNGDEEIPDRVYFLFLGIGLFIILLFFVIFLSGRKV